jgi:predicted TIM-barrel fold metal-dependent hydrolase
VTPFVDCDVHNSLPSLNEFKKYLPSRWHADLDARIPGRLSAGATYPTRPQNGSNRGDSKPPTGGPAGSDFDFLKQHYLDAWPVRRALLAPLDAFSWPQSGAFGAALNSAMNDWLVDQWLGRDPRLYAAIGIPLEDGPRAAHEIERLADHGRFVQVMMTSRTRDPMGDPKYWPIYEAAVEARLPIGVHVGGAGNPMTSAGWPSYYFEYHASYAHTFPSQIVSLIASGVFDALPDLKFVLEEGGFGWSAPLAWRMDRAWRLMGKEITHLDVPPSELLRQHFWFTTQPIDEPEHPQQLLEILEQLDRMGFLDHLMFATDYPHWDFDSPELAFPSVVSGDLKERIFHRNADQLYRFDVE